MEATTPEIEATLNAIRVELMSCRDSYHFGPLELTIAHRHGLITEIVINPRRHIQIKDLLTKCGLAGKPGPVKRS